MKSLQAASGFFSRRLQDISAFSPWLFKTILFPPAGILTACRRFHGRFLVQCLHGLSRLPSHLRRRRKKALFKFVYSRTRAYGTGTAKAAPRVPTRFREKIIRPFPSVRQNKRFPGLQPDSAVHPGTFCKKPFPIQIIQCRNGETGTLPHQSAHVPPPCPCQSSHT